MTDSEGRARSLPRPSKRVLQLILVVLLACAAVLVAVAAGHAESQPGSEIPGVAVVGCPSVSPDERQPAGQADEITGYLDRAVAAERRTLAPTDDRVDRLTGLPADPLLRLRALTGYDWASSDAAADYWRARCLAAGR
ncbi:hypothetical protein [Asanoa ishikariensis]|uniref:hypothetical protein n=1 Tax=Asanoa ishikariensis TaxID=137265 RepID=UPI000B87E31B|nr:hypothetical protein [Asanoa ishikariensis]